MQTRISIGVLAHNESATIGAMLASLLRQDVFDAAGPDLAVEVVVVPNGCRDDTAAKARDALAELMAARPRPGVTCKVAEVAEPGKSRSWNHFVHELADQTADFLVLVDADIDLHEPRAVSSLIAVLREHPESTVSVSKAVKDVAFKKKTLVSRLSLAVSSARKEDYTWICGQLYCGRGPTLRAIWMPIGLPVEDGFLWGVIVTDGFTKPTNPARVIAAPQAEHSFEAVLNPLELIHHETRIVLGMCINGLVWEFLEKASAPDRDGGQVVREENARDPNWLAPFIQKSVAARTDALIPVTRIFHRFKSLRNRTLAGRLRYAPIALLALPADVLVFVGAIRELRRSSGVGFW